MNELSNEAWREQCLLYLLGELPTERLAEFEARLGEADWFGDELAKMAETIQLVAEAPTPCQASPPLCVHDADVDSHACLDSHSGSSRLVLLAITLAASVMIAFVVGKQTRDPAENTVPNAATFTEATLVARAWAQSVSVLQLDEESLSEFAMNDLVLDGPEEFFTRETESDADDSAFAWIVAAIDDGDQIDG
ncbi:hypothetical protein [Novipirellula rosea]|uniref:Anti sigma-E protein RseA N-terminal domain-containing protein n=1 Tax=Novipirellula rosea TaxID=1031540 RepID=A0ABP8MFI2_9BACT